MPAARAPARASATSSRAISAAAPAIARSSTAALEACARRARRPFRRSGAGARRGACRARGRRGLFVGDADGFFAAPASLDSLAALYARPSRRDAGRRRDRCRASGSPSSCAICRKIIWLGRVARLRRDRGQRDDALDLRRDCHARRRRAACLRAIHPDLGELMRRFGSLQVRASGTVGGNIANGSPIGDLAARADRARRRRSSCARARRRAPCRSKTSSSPMASRTAQPGEFVRARRRVRGLRADQHYPRLQGVASVSTRTFPPSWRAFALRPRRPAHRRRAHCLRRHGGDARSAPRRCRGARSSGADLDDRLELERARSGDRAGFHAAHRHARHRRLSLARSPRNLLEKALIEISGATRADPDRRCSHASRVN